MENSNDLGTLSLTAKLPDSQTCVKELTSDASEDRERISGSSLTAFPRLGKRHSGLRFSGLHADKTKVAKVNFFLVLKCKCIFFGHYASYIN